MRQIDGKFKTSGDITKLDGTPVPEDEPLILFRAKDACVPEMLEHYSKLCKEKGSPEAHVAHLDAYIEKMKQWQADHQDRVKIPD